MPVNVISLSQEKKHEHMWVKISDDQIWESRTVKLLGITIDNELEFDEYISNIC